MLELHNLGTCKVGPQVFISAMDLWAGPDWWEYEVAP